MLFRSNVNKVSTKNEKLNNSSVFSLSNITVNGLIENEDQNITSDAADSISKFSGSFLLKNNLSGSSTGEIIVVVHRPDGKILKSTSWETGTFETKDGMRVYSAKIKYDCDKGDSKPLTFTITADDYPRGNYNIEFYQNGILLAKTAKSLN